MPSPIAHSAAGYLLGQLLPWERPQPGWGLRIAYPVLIANVADLDLIPQLLLAEPYHRTLTHGLLFTVVFSAIAAAVACRIWRRSYRELLGLTLAVYGSHLVLDILTEGRGIQLLSPFVNQFIRSPIFIFPGVHYSRGLWDLSHLLPFSFELGLSALLFWSLRRWRSRRQPINVR